MTSSNAPRGFRADAIAPSESAADSVKRASRILEVLERGDGTAIVRGMREVFDTLELAHAAALESVYDSSSSYYMADVRVTRACEHCAP